MSAKFGISSSPHTRSTLTTNRAMYGVVLALLPATVLGVWNFGFHALLVILCSVATAVLSEFVFDYICKRGMTVKDGSAVVTGLLLALCLPSTVPLYIPFLGALFAIIVAKCLFGGLGKNFMNPALAARGFLLISFSGTMTNYVADTVSGATPLVDLSTGTAVSISKMFMGGAGGVIGSSIFGLLVGGLFLLAFGGITWEIPVASLVSFSLFITLFGGMGLDPLFILAHLCGGGIVMAAFFMATDPVTSPVTRKGQLIYGAAVGILSGLFRVFASSADSVSYAVIISNLLTPILDTYIVPKPYAYRKGADRSGSAKEKGAGTLNAGKFIPAIALCAITLVAGVALSGVYNMTEETIAQRELEERLAAYEQVLPEATDIGYTDETTQLVDDLGGAVYGSDYGNVHINEVVVGTDASGNVVGYGISVTSGDGYDGDISIAAGISTDGTLNGIAFTELAETAGMGMKADEPEFKDQFSGIKVDSLTLNKAGGSTSDDEIDSISGASTTSGAVVNAVNAALDFFQNNLA